MYKLWHQAKGHLFVHWFAFLFVSVSLTSMYVATIEASALTIGTYSGTTVTISANQIKKARRPLEDRIILKWRDTTTKAEQTRIMAKYSLKEVSAIKKLGIKTLLIAETDTPEEVIQNLRVNEQASIYFADLVYGKDTFK